MCQLYPMSTLLSRGDGSNHPKSQDADLAKQSGPLLRSRMDGFGVGSAPTRRLANRDLPSLRELGRRGRRIRHHRIRCLLRIRLHGGKYLIDLRLLSGAQIIHLIADLIFKPLHKSNQ